MLAEPVEAYATPLQLPKKEEISMHQKNGPSDVAPNFCHSVSTKPRQHGASRMLAKQN